MGYPYRHHYTDDKGNHVTDEYDTRQEADYYRQKRGGRVVATYKVCDLQKGLFTDDHVNEASSPLEAARMYVKAVYPGRKVEVDLSGTGPIVVRGHRTSKVYNVF